MDTEKKTGWQNEDPASLILLLEPEEHNLRMIAKKSFRREARLSFAAILVAFFGALIPLGALVFYLLRAADSGEKPDTMWVYAAVTVLLACVFLALWFWNLAADAKLSALAAEETAQKCKWRILELRFEAEKRKWIAQNAPREGDAVCKVAATETKPQKTTLSSFLGTVSSVAGAVAAVMKK